MVKLENILNKTKRRTLGILAGLTLGISSIMGCDNNYSEYYFEGKVGNEKIKMYSTLHGAVCGRNILKVTKPDGKVVIYVDCGYLRLDYIEIINNSIINRYDDKSPDVFNEGKKQFKEYLKSIKLEKQKLGLEDLKKETPNISQILAEKIDVKI